MGSGACIIIPRRASGRARCGVVCCWGRDNDGKSVATTFLPIPARTHAHVVLPSPYTRTLNYGISIITSFVMIIWVGERATVPLILPSILHSHNPSSIVHHASRWLMEGKDTPIETTISEADRLPTLLQYGTHTNPQYSDLIATTQ